MSTSHFKLTFPEKGADEDSDNIHRPEKIVKDFRKLAEPFFFYKFLHEHLTDLLYTGFFQDYTTEGLDQFSFKYNTVCDFIYQLEQHAADWSKEFHIRVFLKDVLRKDQEEVEEANEAMQEIKGKYGSLTNGLHHYIADWQKKQNLNRQK